MKKKLITLEEHNRKSMSTQITNEPKLNGIACPKCGSELYDTNPMVVLTSYPPQKNIHCVECDYVGFSLM